MAKVEETLAVKAVSTEIKDFFKEVFKPETVLAPRNSLKVVFFVHFFLISCTFGGWASSLYWFYNSVYLGVLLLAILSKYEEQEKFVQLALGINLISLVLDLLCFIAFHVYRPYVLLWIVAVVHFLLRPVTSFMIVRSVRTSSE